MFVNNRVVFFKRKFLREGADAIKIKLSKVREVENQTLLSRNTVPYLIGELNSELVIEV